MHTRNKKYGFQFVLLSISIDNLKTAQHTIFQNKMSNGLVGERWIRVKHKKVF